MNQNGLPPSSAAPTEADKLSDAQREAVAAFEAQRTRRITRRGMNGWIKALCLFAFYVVGSQSATQFGIRYGLAVFIGIGFGSAGLLLVESLFERARTRKAQLSASADDPSPVATGRR